MTNITYREAQKSDAGLAYEFIKGLAEFEKLSHEVTATQEMVTELLFGKNPKAFCMIAEADGKPAGFAVCYYNVSTFRGKSGIYIEDLFVKEEFRGLGIGQGFFSAISEKGVAEGCGLIQFAVLDWNQKAIDFYKGLGAELQKDWTLYRIEGDAMKALAKNKIKKVA